MCGNQEEHYNTLLKIIPGFLIIFTSPKKQLTELEG